MKIVTKEEFYQYFSDKEFTRHQGDCMHSELFVINKEIVGYFESSSWGAEDIYKLKYGTQNTEAITLVGNMIKNKLK